MCIRQRIGTRIERQQSELTASGEAVREAPSGPSEGRRRRRGRRRRSRRSGAVGVKAVAVEAVGVAPSGGAGEARRGQRSLRNLARGPCGRTQRCGRGQRKITAELLDGNAKSLLFTSLDQSEGERRGAERWSD